MANIRTTPEGRERVEAVTAEYLKKIGDYLKKLGFKYNEGKTSALYSWSWMKGSGVNEYGFFLLGWVTDKKKYETFHIFHSFNFIDKRGKLRELMEFYRPSQDFVNETFAKDYKRNLEMAFNVIKIEAPKLASDEGVNDSYAFTPSVRGRSTGGILESLNTLRKD